MKENSTLKGVANNYLTHTLLLTGIYTLYKNDIRRKSNNEVICN